MQWVRNNGNNGILERPVNVAAVVAGDRLDLVPVLIFKAAVLMAPSAIASKILRKFAPRASPIDRSHNYQLLD
jgi:hypothetical protein